MSLFDDDPPPVAVPQERHALGEVTLGTGGTVRSVRGRCGAPAARVTALGSLVTCPDCQALEQPATASTTPVQRRTACLACSAAPEPGGLWCGHHAAVVARAAAAASG